VAPLLAQVLAVDDAGKRGLPLGAVEVRFDLVGRLGADVADAQPCQQAIFALQPAVQSRRWLATVGSAILGLSAALSGISGFSMASLPGPILTGCT
jgi:hypothetical protein